MNKFEESLYKIRKALQLQDTAGNLLYNAYDKIDEAIDEALNKIKDESDTPTNETGIETLESFQSKFTLVDNHLAVEEQKEAFERVRQRDGEESALAWQNLIKECMEASPFNFYKLAYGEKVFFNYHFDDATPDDLRDLNYIKSLNETSPNKIWSIIDEGNRTTCESGFITSESVVGFLVTEEEFSSKIKFIIDASHRIVSNRGCDCGCNCKKS